MCVSAILTLSVFVAGFFAMRTALLFWDKKQEHIRDIHSMDLGLGLMLFASYINLPAIAALAAGRVTRDLGALPLFGILAIGVILVLSSVKLPKLQLEEHWTRDLIFRTRMYAGTSAALCTVSAVAIALTWG